MNDITQPPRRRPGRPYAGGSAPTRSLRMGPTWDRAAFIAEQRGERLTAVIEAGLRRYIARHRHLLDQQPD